MTDLDVELASVRVALAAALAEKGANHTYEVPQVLVYDDEDDRWHKREADGCLYVEPVFDEDDTVQGWVPSCLWGHVLVTLGVEAEALEVCNQDGVDSISLPKPWDSEIISEAARHSQIEQDNGHSWGFAVSEFERVLKERGVTL